MGQFAITEITAREVINSIWQPTIEVTVVVDQIYSGVSITPMGQSTGSLEAKELRDGGDRYDGRGCLAAVANVEGEIREQLIGLDATRQRQIDKAMIDVDGVPDKSRLGANAIVATSAAVAKAAANAVGLPLYRYLNHNAHILPIPYFSLIDGGHYAYGAGSAVQEFLIVATGATQYSEALEMGRKVYSCLMQQVIDAFGPLAQSANTCGGFSLPIPRCRDTLDFLMQALADSGMADNFAIALDCAASGWYVRNKDKYQFEGELLGRAELLDFYKQLLRDYPIVSIEDPFDENDVEGFAMATRELDAQIVGDDFFVTNPSIMRERLPLGAGNALLWKYNQIGTLSEAFDAADLAFRHGCGVMPSPRSGETEDSLLSDLTVALNAGQNKAGVPVRSEQSVKYNRFLQIEKELGNDARFGGEKFGIPLRRWNACTSRSRP